MEIIIVAVLFLLISGLMGGGSVTQGASNPKSGAVGCLLTLALIAVAVLLLMGGIAGEVGGPTQFGPILVEPTFAPGHGPRR